MKANSKSEKSIDVQAPVQPSPMPQVQGYVGNPQIFMSRDGESLIHRLPGNMKFELHVNLYKKILGVEFTPKERRAPADPSVPRPRIYGFIAQPEIFLSRDGQYLVHRVLGMRISKHVNFYKKLMNVPFTAKGQSAVAATESQVA